eukprot:CAMPEP_0194770880 /NCGR_PEP_ID=MMETSP0323_2-20130528/47568_1 /TAXON_ID=2866 ORGANISM="Crypthecodinium cohnii, Strain Seligo" /NCGR_SAMPLE_ID=MMETSP0323_2 /ASSEMBLY_ACC=CAM_ASM_000346 /LENGTH=75 /DNA_ID=CAMNT_0039704675 /DNA_START=264 /DNA_END=491 /DNA_ORIENTATION=-
MAVAELPLYVALADRVGSHDNLDESGEGEGRHARHAERVLGRGLTDMPLILPVCEGVFAKPKVMVASPSAPRRLF